MPAPLLPLVDRDLQVPLVDGRSVRHVNLDGAASATALQVVADRVTAVLPWYASVHRGAGFPSQVSTNLYEDARTRVGAFVDAGENDVVVVTRNTTDATNLLASAVPGRVLVLDLEHHANLLPWRRAVGGADVLATQDTVEATLTSVEAQLLSGHYTLVAFTGASNVTGEALPVDKLVAIARRHGCRTFLDAAQLAAHRRFSLRASGVDYVAFSGHKVYAPFGAGALVGPRDWLDEAEPYLAGGGAVRRVSEHDVAWSASPSRHEAGTPNLVGAVALATATQALAALPQDAWRAHEQGLLRRLQAGLHEVPGVRVARLWRDSGEVVGVTTFGIKGTDPRMLATFLAAEHGVSVRDGRFCAHPLLDRLGWPEGAVRASVGVGTSSDDVDRLLEGLDAWVSGRRHARYRSRNGAWTVVNDPRPAPSDLDLAGLERLPAPCAS